MTRTPAAACGSNPRARRRRPGWTRCRALPSTRSMANFSAAVTARGDRLGDDGRYDDAIVYTSAEAHHSVSKAVRLAGIPAANVRALAVDEGFRLRPGALAAAVSADRALGRRPF